MEGRYVITEIDMATGKPLGEHANKFVNHCGFVVRDRIPISCREWHKKLLPDGQPDPSVSFVSDTDKDLLWRSIIEHFGIEGDDDTKRLVRDFAMKKMATQFQCWKKELYKNFVAKNTVPNFSQPKYAKLRPFWDAFVQYKTSEESIERVRRNQQNARQKKYHHTLGSGGYASALPKWDKRESDLINRGIRPESVDWPDRSRRWFFGHGGKIDEQTGNVIYGPVLRELYERIKFALAESAQGRFRPRREKDELSYAIGTLEHCGRTRGYGAVPWEHGFPADRDSYRSHSRRKAEEQERLHRVELELAASREREKAMQESMADTVKMEVQRQLQEILSKRSHSSSAQGPLVNISPSMLLNSSVGDTEITGGRPLQRFPVDDVTIPNTPCELHIAHGQGSIKVADGIVSPIDPTKTPIIHGRKVPAGYARVSVDRVVREHFNVPLEIEGGDGEKTLGEAEKTFICWRKRYIMIPGASPTPPPPPSPGPRYGC